MSAKTDSVGMPGKLLVIVASVTKLARTLPTAADVRSALGEGIPVELGVGSAAFQSFLRVIVTKERPLVLFLDDLQWATAFPIGVVDAVLGPHRAVGHDGPQPRCDLLDEGIHVGALEQALQVVVLLDRRLAPELRVGAGTEAARRLKPEGFDPSRRDPVIVYHYGGPGSQVVAERTPRSASQGRNRMS